MTFGKGAGSAFGLPGIFDNVRDGLALVAMPEGRVVLFNRAASQMCGISVRTAMGKPFATLFLDTAVTERAATCAARPVGQWPGHEQDLLVASLRRNPGHHVEIHFCRVDEAGAPNRLVLLVMRPSLSKDLIVADTKTELKVAQLEGRAREMALFFAQAAHEFRTPLTVVAMQVELVAGSLGPLASGQMRALHIATNNVGRLIRLAQDLADLAKADAGRLTLTVDHADLAVLAAEETAGLAPRAKLQAVRLRVGRPQGPVHVTGDVGRLRQVMSNLISNALKFTPAGGLVSVTASVAAGMARFAVVDDGRGITHEGLDGLFRPFARVDRGLAPAVPGTGLGLYLCKRIVEAHGGAIGCTSAGAGLGTTAWFEVPVAATRSAAAPRRT